MSEHLWRVTADMAQDSKLKYPKRRTFLKMLAGGAGLSTVALVSACDSSENDDDDDAPAVNLGTGDVGVLNYAYALEQLEAAFYTQVTADFYSGATDADRRVLEDLRDHEIAHREFLKGALGTGAIPALSVDFSEIDFDSRESVLTTARIFEDLGVAAYNGAGKLLTTPAFLVAAGKIVSVEARHASAIRDLITPNSPFSLADDLVDDDGLDRAMTPSQVLSAAGGYINNQITFSGLPTS